MDKKADRKAGGVEPEEKDWYESTAKVRLEIYDWLSSIMGAVLFCVFLFVFGFRMIGVDGRSMQPTLYTGDQVIISNLFFTPKTGDVIVFRKESFKHEPLVKRVIAVEGQTVNIDFQRGVVIVDGVELDEPYTETDTNTRSDFVGPVTVPEGHLFVMGDNRNVSLDSRDDDVGFVDVRYVLGKVHFVMLPFSNLGVVKGSG